MSRLTRLKEARTLSDLAIILGYEPSALAYILYKIPEDKKYTTFFIPKKSGGIREIKAPTNQLKKLQRRLCDLLMDCSLEISSSRNGVKSVSHGFKKDFSIITNAQSHIRRRYVFNLDLEGFFPSINFGRVRGFFIHSKNFRLNPKVATILAQISCHANSLPQGSPCSPIISDLIGHILDTRLVKIAKRNRCSYSRYADDITFSTNEKHFPTSLAKQPLRIFTKWMVGKKLQREINTSGFAVNPKKTRMQYRISRQEVTGLVVNKKANVKAEYYRRVRSMCSFLFKNGFYYHVLEDRIEENSSSRLISFLRKLKELFFAKGRRKKSRDISMARTGTLEELEGMLSHIHNVKNAYDNRFRKSHNDRVQKSHNTLVPLEKENGRKEKIFTGSKKLYHKFLFFKYFHASQMPLIVCEGKTDYVYLRYALRSLYKDYPSFLTIDAKKITYHIKFLNHTRIASEMFGLGGSGGLTNLIAHYKENLSHYRAQGKKHPVVILVDNDDGAKSLFSTMKNVMNSPDAIDGTKEFYHVLENLYVVSTPKAKGALKSKIEDFFPDEVLKKKLDGRTLNLDNEVNTATEYGKNDFAEKIVRQGREQIDFSRFKEILDPISKAIQDYSKHAVK